MTTTNQLEWQEIRDGLGINYDSDFRPQRMNLSQALELFADHTDDIENALAENVTHSLESLRPWPEATSEAHQFVLDGLRELEIEQMTQIPLKTIRRIQTQKYYQEVEAQTGYVPDRITEDDKIRAKEVPIEQLYDGQLRRHGGKLWGCCPFHEEKTASFCIHDDNRWSCFGQCGEHGDSIDYVIKSEGLTGNMAFITAVKSLTR